MKIYRGRSFPFDLAQHESVAKINGGDTSGGGLQVHDVIHGNGIEVLLMKLSIHSFTSKTTAILIINAMEKK